MSLLIDGYNLLHASGIMGKGRGPRGFEQSRLALLNFLAESVPAAELAHTIVVFDATNAPPGLPKVLEHRGMAVRFARDREGADALIEELILADSAPRKLTVVSSDHRLHRAARRRRATPIDSDKWYAEAVRRRQQRKPPAAARPRLTQSPSEVEYWLREFSDTDTLDADDDEATLPEGSTYDPFPPGYADDVFDEEG